MKLNEFIAKLSAFDPELKVAIADWSEQYADPSDDAASEMKVQRVVIWNEESETHDLVTRLVIGNAEETGWTDESFKRCYAEGRIL